MRPRDLAPALFAAALLLSIPATCLADGGDEGPDEKTTSSSLIYPNSLPMKAGEQTDRVTNENHEKIRAFYQKTLGPYDQIVPLADAANFHKGFSVIYRVHYKGADPKSLSEFARVDVMMPDTVAYKKATPGLEYLMPEALLSLQRLVGRFGHTQADYDKIFNAWQWVRYVQFWPEGADGGTITKKYHEKVFGQVSTAQPKKKAGDDARMADLEKKKKRMKELKASGDMAAMMALAQEMQAEMAQTGAGEHAQQFQEQMMEGVQKDSWEDWVACLKEMAQAAYWTRLEYSKTGGWWSEDFWRQAPAGKVK